MEKQIFEPIIDLIQTTSDLAQLRSAIDEALSQLFDVKKNSSFMIIKKCFQYVLSTAVIKAMQDQNIALDKNSTKYFLEQLKEQTKNLDSLTLQIAFVPQDAFVSKIAEYLLDSFGHKVILDIQLKPEILGGAIIVYNGRYLDYSLTKKIEAVFREKAKVIYAI